MNGKRAKLLRRQARAKRDEQQQSIPCLKLPPEQGQLVDRVMARDEEFFRENPSIKEYVRPYIKGEARPVPVPASVYAVRVIDLGNGRQQRLFLAKRGGQTVAVAIAVDQRKGESWEPTPDAPDSPVPHGRCPSAPEVREARP